MPFLIDTLKQSGPIDFTFVSRSPLLNLKKKDGGYYEAYEYTFTVGGKERKEKIFPGDHDYVLSKAELHQVCRAEVNPQKPKFVKWTLIPFGEAALSVPKPASNTQMNKNAGAYNDSQDAEQSKWDKIALSKIVHEFMKAGYASGKSIETCAEDAEKLTKAQFQVADRIWTERNQ